MFDLQKLEWLNGQYLHEMSAEAILDEAGPFFVEKEMVTEAELTSRRDYLLKLIPLLRERVRLLPEFAEMSGYFFREPESYDEKGAAKYFSEPDAADRLDRLAARFELPGIFDEHTAEEHVRGLAEELEVSPAKIIHPTRLAVTGTTQGPGLFELMTVIGRERVIARLRRAATYIREKAG